MSYKEFLEYMDVGSSRTMWVQWKVHCHGMSHEDATQAPYAPEWGYMSQSQTEEA